MATVVSTLTFPCTGGAVIGKQLACSFVYIHIAASRACGVGCIRIGSAYRNFVCAYLCPVGTVVRIYVARSGIHIQLTSCSGCCRCTNPCLRNGKSSFGVVFTGIGKGTIVIVFQCGNGFVGFYNNPYVVNHVLQHHVVVVYAIAVNIQGTVCNRNGFGILVIA